MDIHVIFVNALMLIAVLNPFGNVPLFIGMTDGMEKDDIIEELEKNR